MPECWRPTWGGAMSNVPNELLRVLGKEASLGVLNGIAYDEERATFLLTGKNWPRLFEVIWVE